jgi:endonuclease/exonuclease/phosphatase family metal-dependent hydrolase
MRKTFISMLGTLLLVACSGPAPLKVMSYNIRYGTADDGEYSWPNRQDAAVAMILDQRPAVFGVQEGLRFQLDFLTEKCPMYKYVGVGREDGEMRGEHMAVFYDTTRVELKNWGTYWLSETPDEPSKGWDAACKRTATWTLLHDIKADKYFYFVDTHLDHVGEEAREKGLALVVERIGAMNPENYPMVLLGDFNVFPDDPCLKGLRAVMTDAREAASVTTNESTYHGYGTVVKDPIDYIFYKGFSGCKELARVTKPYEECLYVSDHYPITAILTY